MTSAFSSNESASLEKSVELNTIYGDLSEIWCPARLTDCTKWIQNNGFQKVCLQFPDNLLEFSVQILSEIQNVTAVNVFILGDTSYGSCCVDETAAAHVNADAIIHFGHACLSKTTRLPVFYVFPNYKIDLNHFVDEFTNAFPDKRQRIALFFNVGYFYHLDSIKKALQSYESIQYGNLAVDGDSDLLCWKLGSIEQDDTIVGIYIGRDDQTFFNLSLSLSIGKWFLYDSHTTAQTKPTLIETTVQASAWLRRRLFYVEKCKDAQCIGIVVATLTANGYLDVVKRVQTLARARGIRTYIFSVGKVNPAKLANFMEVDCFVLIGCPENNIFTSRDFYKPLLSVFEVELALNLAWHGQIPTNYSVDFRDILPNGKLYRTFDGLKIDENDVSLITGKVRVLKSDDKQQEKDADDVDKMDGIVQERKNYQIQLAASNSSAVCLDNRSWSGLDPALGQTEPAVLEKGRSGIAMSYAEATNTNT